LRWEWFSVIAHIDYEAPQNVRDVIASLGQTEDVRFSPDNRRMAVASYFSNKIAVFDVSVTTRQGSKNIQLTGVTEFSSASLNTAHGLDFIDDKTMVVANRDGQVCIFSLPHNAAGAYELEPVAIVGSGETSTPGSVAVVKKEDGLCEILICNNYAHRVTKHLLDLNSKYLAPQSGVFIKRWLNIPDGICVSKEADWIAVSNHNTQNVLIYENAPSLHAESNPHGILRHTGYPHGVRFTADGQFILVTDAGSPHVRIYKGDRSGWRGVRDPILSLKVLNDDAFLRGRRNEHEGGPKGVDINNDAGIFVTTCETQPLTFFDLTSILGSAPSDAEMFETSKLSRWKSWSRVWKTLEVIYALHRWYTIDLLSRTGRNLLSRVSSFPGLRPSG
jgi:DNA-binding beta-propeller fold protein YncE